MAYLIRLMVNAIALAVATWLLPGITMDTSDPVRAVVVVLVVALIFGVVNSTLKPIFRFFTSPLVWLTLGLFLLVINTLMLWLTSGVSGILKLGWHVDGFWWACAGSLVVSVVSFFLEIFVPGAKERERRKAARSKR